MSGLPKNYRWWQEHGQEWVDEVATRKAHMPIYHLQEIFLSEYFAAAAPAKVLEFGCGFGRHLEYLRKIPKLDLYGFDQSESMLSGMTWARPNWRKKRIATGEPLSTLPYEDDSFDIVYTVSVLIHVRPADLDQVMSELWRVSRGHVIHIENNDTDETRSTSDAHDGCWAHDLRAAYARIAPEADFEVGPSLFEIEDIYRVSENAAALPEMIGTSRAERFLSLDTALSNQIQSLRQELGRGGDAESKRAESAEARLEIVQRQLDAAQERARGMDARFAEFQKRAENADQRVTEFQQRVEKSDQKVAEFGERSRTSERRIEEFQERAQSADSRITEFQVRARSAEERIAELLERVRSAHERSQELKGRAVAAESRIAELDQAAGEQRERARGAETTLLELRERITDTEDRMADQQARIADHRSKTDALRDRALDAERRVAESGERLKQAGEFRAEATGRAKKAETQSQEWLERSRTAEARLLELRGHADRLEKTGETDRALRSDLESEVRGLRDFEDGAKARHIKLFEKFEVEVARSEQFQANVASAQGEQERLVELERVARSEVIALRRRGKRAEEETSVFRDRARDAESKLGEAEQRASDHRLRANQAEADLHALREEAARLAGLEAEMASLRNQLVEILGR